MVKKKKSSEIGEAELRRMLMDRRSQDRKNRLNSFEKEGILEPLQHQSAGSANSDESSNTQEGQQDGITESAPQSMRRKWLDRLLLAIEALAILGLAIIFMGGLSLLSDLNSQVASLFEEQIEVSPTAILSAAVVLPSGHTAPDPDQPSRPNTAEIPAHLRPQVQSYSLAIVVPTPGPEQAKSIQIDSLDLRAPVVQGDDWEALKRGVGQHIGSGDPGENGNLVLSGHNDIFGEIFRHLDQLSEGDKIIIHSETHSYTYIVTSTQVVAPSFVQVMDTTPDSTLTLISCYPYLVDNQRIVVQASLQ